MIIIILLVLIDQVVKFLISTNLNIYESINIIPNIFDITYAKNTGAAFSLLNGNNFLIIIISLIAIYFIYMYLLKEEKSILIKALILSGVISNLIDRIIRGFVVDYFNFKLINFPIFNIADICIVIGFLLYIIKSFRKK